MQYYIFDFDKREMSEPYSDYESAVDDARTYCADFMILLVKNDIRPYIEICEDKA